MEDEMKVALRTSPSAYGFIDEKPDSLYGMLPHEFMKVRGWSEMCIAQCLFGNAG